jgi:hypothetical protein
MTRARRRVQRFVRPTALQDRGLATEKRVGSRRSIEETGDGCVDSKILLFLSLRSLSFPLFLMAGGMECRFFSDRDFGIAVKPRSGHS